MSTFQARTLSTLTAAALLGLAGCADAPTAAAPSLARVAPTTTATDGRYIVRLQGRGDRLASAVAAAGGTVTFIHSDAGIAVVSGLSAAGAQKLAANAAVAELQPDVQVQLALPAEPVLVEAAVDAMSQTNPATAIRYSWQWNMRAINADKAWAAGRLGSSGVTVAILDTGIDYTALDLNGLVDLSRSTSFVPSDDAIRNAAFPTRHVVDDFNRHGTNVATQVSSIGFAHAGVTSRTTLIGVKVLGASGSGSTAGVLQGVLWAADHGADVINMSLGGAFTKSQGGGSLVSLINQVFNYATRKGALVVVAAGNSAADLDHDIIPNDTTGAPEHYPSLYSTYCDTPAVLCVSAVGPVTAGGTADIAAVYSNYGRSAISVAGPGGNIGETVSTWPWGPHVGSFVWSMCARNYLPNPQTPATRPCASGGSTIGMLGTSQASPHVAGLAALLVAELGRGNPAQVKARIQQTAVDAGQPGVDPFFGRGRIDVARALGL